MVTASRVERPLSTIPNTVTVVNSVELEAQLAINNDISTVLGNLIPSFSPSRQKMTNAGESLRGRKPLYMIDGVPQSSPLREGGRDGHIIDNAVIERIEVLHGANAIHGLGASGGIINLITKKPTDSLQQSLRADGTFQTENIGESGDYGVAYSISNRFDNLDFLASLSMRDSGIAYDANGEVIGSDNTQGDTMDSRTLNAFLKTGYEWGEDQRVELTFNRYDVEGNNDWISVPGNVAAGIPSSAVKGHIVGEGARNKVTNISLTYADGDFLGHSLRAQVFSQDLESTYGAEATPIATFQDPAFGPNLIDQSQNNSEKVGVKITLAKDEIAGLPFNLVYGLDVLVDETWQSLIRTGRSWVPKSRSENYAPFLQGRRSGGNHPRSSAGSSPMTAPTRPPVDIPAAIRRIVAREKLLRARRRIVLGLTLIPLSCWAGCHALPAGLCLGADELVLVTPFLLLAMALIVLGLARYPRRAR